MTNATRPHKGKGNTTPGMGSSATNTRDAPATRGKSIFKRTQNSLATMDSSRRNQLNAGNSNGSKRKGVAVPEIAYRSSSEDNGTGDEDDLSEDEAEELNPDANNRRDASQPFEIRSDAEDDERDESLRTPANNTKKSAQGKPSKKSTHGKYSNAPPPGNTSGAVPPVNPSTISDDELEPTPTRHKRPFSAVSKESEFVVQVRCYYDRGDKGFLTSTL